MRALAAAGAVLALLAACGPPRGVDISEQASGSLLAAGRADGPQCSEEQKTRTLDEARYYCTARGRRATFGAKGPKPVEDGCSYQAEFWCAAK